MHSSTQQNKKKAQRQASFDSEDEGDFVADEQAHVGRYNQMDHEEFFNGTQEHDQGGRNGIQGFVTPTAFIDKNSLAQRKNRFVINNNLKIKQGKVQTTKNSISRKDKINIGSTSPRNSQNYSVKNVAFVSAQKPTIQNLPPSIVLSSKQYKLNGTTQIKGGANTVTHSFANSPNGGHFKNQLSFADNRNMNQISSTNKSSPVGKYKINQHLGNKQQIVKQSFKSSQTAGSGNGSDTFAFQQYNTLNQNIKSQISIMNKQKQMEATKNQHQNKSQKNMTIKTKCVSLEVSQERESDLPNSYFKTNTVKNKLIAGKVKNQQQGSHKLQSHNKVVNNTGGPLKIKRKPMISQTMKNSKKTSLNSTPTRPVPLAFKSPGQDDSNLPLYKLQGSQEYSRMDDIKSPPANTMNQSLNNESVLPESMHNIQFTRNTQANSKTVSNVAQVLHPHQQTKKNLSHTKSVALSIENSDVYQGNQSRVNSMCTSLTHLSKNINLRLDNRVSNGAINQDEVKSKDSSNREDNIHLIQTNQIVKPSGLRSLKKPKGHISSVDTMSPIKSNELINNITVSPGQLGIVSSIGKTAPVGVSFTKSKMNIKNFDYVSGSKNMNINESMVKKTIGLSDKLKLGSTNGGIGTNNNKTVNNINTGHYTPATRITSNYISKTAQASVYASKNNSQNSSMARVESNNPSVMHKSLGSRIGAAMKKKKQGGISSDQDQSSLVQSKQSASNFNIGHSSLSLKDKQLPMTTGKKQSVGVKMGEASNSALRHATNDHYTQSQKSNMYSTVGSKTIKSNTTVLKKGFGAKAGGQHPVSQSQNFLSMTNNTLKTKTKLSSNLSMKQDIKSKEAYRSANVSSSMTKQSKMVKYNANQSNSIKSTNKVRLIQNRSNPNAERNQQRQSARNVGNEERSFSTPIRGAAESLNTPTNQGISQPKKQLQPSQAKNSKRSVKDSYRRAGYSSVNISNSPNQAGGEPENNYSTRYPVIQNNHPKFQFNDIKEEIKETESQQELNLNVNQPTFHIEDNLIQQQNDNFRDQNLQLHKETPKSTIRKRNEDNDNSMILQLQEYKKDIKNLKKNIFMYFKQYSEMQCSQCNFYRIGRVLGRGAFGKVNLACHKVTEHLVAIKALEKKVLDNEKTTKKRVMQEIAILKQSNHQNVVRLYDSFETQKHICFVMELCQGGDLLSYVRKRRKLKEDNCKYLFKQLIEGLNYIHTQKFVIHRDIKLDNILLDASGKIKICDFGVSKQVKSEKERMYEQCGTPAYIAPEVSNKQRGYRGFKADMWSAGVCLYVMLIGTVPFKASSMKELHELIRKGKYSLQGEPLSNEAKNLLTSLINVNYHKRISAKETLQHPWFKMQSDGKARMDYNRSDLSSIIFTQKESETIQKDYITRLEKLKKQRLKKDGPNSNEKDNLRNQTLPHNTTTLDDDFLFTEHNLDTKEDQKQDLFDTSKKFQDLFDKNDQSEFQKFEGLIVKKPIQNEFSHDEEKNLSEKSIIFCPFNSSFSQFDEDHPELFDWPEIVTEFLLPKKSKIIKFSKKCRDLNREYEHNNNADLDNGVYNAFVNEQEMEAEKNQKNGGNLSEEDQMPTQSLQQSSFDSFNDSENMSYINSDNDDFNPNKYERAPQNSFVQDEISIHESMQKGHQNQWAVTVGTSTSPSKVIVKDQLIDYTVELFKNSSDQSCEVYQNVKSKLRSGLLAQDLNYLTAAYYLSQKYDKVDE